MHIELHVIQPARVLAAGTGAFPSAEGLETRPRAGGGALRPVGIGHTPLRVALADGISYLLLGPAILKYIFMRSIVKMRLLKNKFYGKKTLILLPNMVVFDKKTTEIT